MSPMVILSSAGFEAVALLFCPLSIFIATAASNNTTGTPSGIALDNSLPLPSTSACEVTTAAAPDASKICAIRLAGHFASIGMYVAWQDKTASADTTCSQLLCIMIPTMASEPL